MLGTAEIKEAEWGGNVAAHRRVQKEYKPYANAPRGAVSTSIARMLVEVELPLLP